MPEVQNINTYEDHLQAINDYNLQNKYVIQNVSIHEFFTLPVTDTEDVGNDISTYSILSQSCHSMIDTLFIADSYEQLKGSSTCDHLPKYIIVVKDTIDHNMLSIHTSYDHFMNVSFESISYVVYERITDCITCSHIGAVQ
jgi:hypothetical protein